MSLIEIYIIVFSTVVTMVMIGGCVTCGVYYVMTRLLTLGSSGNSYEPSLVMPSPFALTATSRSPVPSNVSAPRPASSDASAV